MPFFKRQAIAGRRHHLTTICGKLVTEGAMSYGGGHAFALTCVRRSSAEVSLPGRHEHSAWQSRPVPNAMLALYRGRPQWDRRVVRERERERENVMCVRKCLVFVDMYIKSYGMPHAIDLEVLNQPPGIEFDPARSAQRP